jgi:hypothetical protein
MSCNGLLVTSIKVYRAGYHLQANLYRLIKVEHVHYCW